MVKPAYLDNNAAALVRLIKDGAIFIRPHGAGNVPTGTDWVPSPSDGQIGYYSDAGYTLTPAPGDSTDISAHNGDVVISEQAPGWWTLGFSGLEGNANITAAYFDIDPNDIGSDGSVVVQGASNSKRYDVVTVGFDQEERLIVAHYPNVQISEKEAQVFNRTTLLAHGLTFRTFKGGPSAPYHFKAWGLVVEETPAPTVQSIAVTGPGTVAENGSITLTATATYSDASTADVTATAAWASSDELTATVSAGLVTGVLAGVADITASLGGVTSPSHEVTVTS